MPHIQLNSAKLFYIQEGQGEEVIVFSHGLLWSHKMFQSQIDFLKKDYTVIAYDHRGQGQSEVSSGPYDMDMLTIDAMELIDKMVGKPVHFVGLSMGGFVGMRLAARFPEKVKSLVMAGAVTRLTTQSRILVFLGNTFKRFIPYMWLYKLFAFIIMPRKQHAESRNLFIHEAQKLCQKEFIRWFKLTKDINPLLKYFKERDIGIPTLYVMGDQDVMFLEPVKKLVKDHKNSILKVLDKCGHVVNVEKPDQFNQLSLAFIKNHQ